MVFVTGHRQILCYCTYYLDGFFFYSTYSLKRFGTQQSINASSGIPNKGISINGSPF